jgi:hypothetical protein
VRKGYLEGHELELRLLAKIRLSVLFQGVFLPKFVLSTIFKGFDLLLATELYVNSTEVQKALERYFECRIPWFALARGRVPGSYHLQCDAETELADGSAYLRHTRGHPI